MLQEDYSNRTGNGFLDIFLKHQVTRERKKAQQKRQLDEMDSIDQLSQQLGPDLAYLMNSALPLDTQCLDDQSNHSGAGGLFDPDSEEAQQLRRFNFGDSPVDMLELMDTMNGPHGGKEDGVKIETHAESSY